MFFAVCEILDDLLPALVPGEPGLVGPALDPRALLVDDVVQLLGDVVVDAAEVAGVELLAAALAEPLDHVAQAHELLAVAVVEALLEHPAERRVQVAVVEEVVGHLREEGVGVDVEPDLGAVPPGVPEPAPR